MINHESWGELKIRYVMGNSFRVVLLSRQNNVVHCQMDTNRMGEERDGFGTGRYKTSCPGKGGELCECGEDTVSGSPLQDITSRTVCSPVIGCGSEGKVVSLES